MNNKEWINDIAQELEYAKDYPYINTPQEMDERLVGFCGYGNIEQVRKETAKDILQRWWRETTVGRKETDKSDGTELWYIKKVAEEYGVEVDNE